MASVSLNDSSAHDVRAGWTAIFPPAAWLAENVLRAVRECLHSEGTTIRLVVCDLSTSPYLDLAGARMLARLSDELAKQHVALCVVEAHATTRDLLRAESLDAKVDGIDRFTSVADAVERFQRESAS
jgi:MFS superfamily sulfate permease-like transporter